MIYSPFPYVLLLSVPIVKVFYIFIEVVFVENIGEAGVFVVIEVNPHIMFGIAIVCVQIFVFVHIYSEQMKVTEGVEQ